MLRAICTAIAIALLTGCMSLHQVPPGYDADTTPGHDGEQWIGGTP